MRLTAAEQGDEQRRESEESMTQGLKARVDRVAVDAGTEVPAYLEPSISAASEARCYSEKL